MRGEHLMPTIKDVAKLAGVSISSVSNVINGSKYVSDELRAVVNQAIDTLGYKADLIARSMRKSRTNTIGVIFVSMNTFTLQVMNGIRSSASKANVQLIFYSTDFSVEKEKRYLDMLVGSKVDGIILTSCAPTEDEKYFRHLAGLEIAGKRIPVVSLERNLTQFGIHSVHVTTLKVAAWLRSTCFKTAAGISR
jgi:DNA-binding LacI/PurR family transcriptional regulator